MRLEAEAGFTVNIAGKTKMIVVMMTLILSVIVIKLIVSLLLKIRDRLFYLHNQHFKDTQ